MKTVETDVLIVGGGIAGSALACALRDSGYWVVLVEQRKGRLELRQRQRFQRQPRILDRMGAVHARLLPVDQIR